MPAFEFASPPLQQRGLLLQLATLCYNVTHGTEARLCKEKEA